MLRFTLTLLAVSALGACAQTGSSLKGAQTVECETRYKICDNGYWVVPVYPVTTYLISEPPVETVVEIPAPIVEPAPLPVEPAPHPAPVPPVVVTPEPTPPVYIPPMSWPEPEKRPDYHIPRK